MPNYFDYMLESADTSIDDMDDYGVEESVYNEMDASMCEFDSYVQEGVGVAIAASVGGAALITGLIALIAKCFGKSSPTSAAKAAKEARKALNEVEKLPDDGCEILTDGAIEESKNNVEACVFDYIAACNAIMEGKEIPSSNPVSKNKKQDNTINYPSFNSTKIDISDISVSLNKDNEKANRKSKSEERQQNLINTQRANRGNKKAGTKITTDKAEANESLAHVEKASNEIDQLRKDLQATERDFAKAEKSGKVKVDPESRKTLEKKRAIAANAVSKESQKLKAPSMGILASLKALAGDVVSKVRKSR